MQVTPNSEPSCTPTDAIGDSVASSPDSEAKSITVSFQHPEGRDPTVSVYSVGANGSALDSRVACYVDRVTDEGYIEGWARNESEYSPCILQILQSGEVIAETAADSFRQDLLDAGIGHGHYAFYARVRDAKPGNCDLEIVEKHLGTVISLASPIRQVIPIFVRPRTKSVQDLLRRRRWTTNDLVRNLGCLHLTENMRMMGPYRFVDITCLFLLDRWMNEKELRHVRQLESGESSAEGFFCEIASSEEHLASTAVLAGPYDGRFPYKIY